MRGALKSVVGILLVALVAIPAAASVRESDHGDGAICTEPKHRHVVLRPLTEPAPIRKKDKVRVRRVLM